jgi:two-component system, cell cycle sensor histidine kinase and response regulator CckA
MGGFANLILIDPDNWRPALLRLILLVSLVLGIIVYVPSLIMSLKSGFYLVAVIDTIAIAAVAALFFFDQFSYRVRSIIFSAIAYLLGVGLLVSVGPVSQIFLFGFSIITTVLLGLRAGIAASILSALSLLAVGAASLMSPEMAIPGWNHDFPQWITITLNFSLVNILLTFSVGAILGAFESALKRSISDREKLDKKHSLLRTLIETSPDVIFTKDTAGRFQYFNSRFHELVGLAPTDDPTGKTVFDLYPRDVAEEFHHEDMRVFSGESIYNREEQGLNNTGEPRWYITIKVPLKAADGTINGLIGISRDITSLKNVAAERKMLLKQLQLQIERLPLAYILTDKDFRYTRWNPAAERIFGFKESEVLGKHPFELIIPESSRVAVSQTFDELKAGSMDSHAIRDSITKEGKSIYCEWHNTPLIDQDGNFAGLISVANDITEQRGLEQQLRQAQKIDAIGKLAGGVAHDFNNLLTIINGYADLLLRSTPPNDKNRGRLEEIQKAGRRSATLTSQLLAFSRKQVMAPRVIDLNEIVQDTESMLSRIIGEDIDLVISLDPSLNTVTADPAQIEQVIFNLVVNARDAMPQGGKLTIETHNVELDASYERFHPGARSGKFVLLSVTDDGEGMTDNVKSQIFEPYFTTKEQGKGTGLGLSVVHGIVKQTGGNIEVYSELGVGTVLKVYLPCSESSAPGRNETIPEAESAPGSERILLVEDEPGVRGFIGATLRGLGYHVVEASNGEEALQIASDLSVPPDMMITDVVMPGMGGRKLAEHITQSFPKIPVLFISGYTDDAVFRHGILQDDVEFLHKPFTPAALSGKIREILKNRPS